MSKLPLSFQLAELFNSARLELAFYKKQSKDNGLPAYVKLLAPLVPLIDVIVPEPKVMPL